MVGKGEKVVQETTRRLATDVLCYLEAASSRKPPSKGLSARNIRYGGG